MSAVGLQLKLRCCSVMVAGKEEQLQHLNISVGDSSSDKQDTGEPAQHHSWNMYCE